MKTKTNHSYKLVTAVKKMLGYKQNRRQHSENTQLYSEKGFQSPKYNIRIMKADETNFMEEVFPMPGNDVIKN